MNKRVISTVFFTLFHIFTLFGLAQAQIELNDVSASFVGENAASAFGYYGSSIVGDIDGDGLDDIAIGAPQEHYGASLDPQTPCDSILPGECGCGGIDPGKVYIIFGKPDGWKNNQPIRQEADLIFVSLFSDTQLGIDIAGGDIDGDGTDALIIGARGFGDDLYQQRGKTYVLFGKSRQEWNDLPTDFDPDCRNPENDPKVKNIEEVADASFIGESTGNYFGNVIATDDLNGDGRSEIIMGAHGYGPQSYLVGNGRIISVGKGKVYVLFGGYRSDPKWGHNLPIGSVSDASFTGGTIPGQRVLNNLYENILVQEQAGFAISGLGDIDGDGSGDFIVGQQRNDPGLVLRRQAYLISGSSVAPQLHTDIQSAALATFQAPDYRQEKGLTNLDSYWYTDFFGGSLAGAGDINHDGRPDFIIGSETYSRQTDNFPLPKCGAAYIFFGRSSSQQWPNRVAIGINGEQTDATFYGTLGYSKMGLTVAGIGDINDDGIDDFMVGGAIDKEGNAQDSGTPLQGGAFDYSRADSFVIFGAIDPPWSLNPFEYLYRNETGMLDTFYPGDFPSFKTQILDYARNTYRYFLGEETGKFAQFFAAADQTSAAGFVAGHGDVNGDGKMDLLIADYLFSTIPSGQYLQTQDSEIHEINKGKVYIQFGGNGSFNDTLPEPWIRDALEDAGRQPDMESISVQNSPDIWVRLDDDDGTTHQNPKYLVYDNGQQPNYVYVRIRNKGTQWTDISGLGTEMIRLYWAGQSTQLAWPGSFNEVGSSPKPVGRLAPGESKTVKFQWYPPDPATFDQWPEQTPRLTLVARIETEPTAPFGMAFPEVGDIWQNVRNNNAIAGKKDVLLYCAPIVNFSTTSQTVIENQSQVTITCQIPQMSGLDTIVNFTVSGTAQAGGIDHDLADGSITIPTGQTSANIVFDITDDKGGQSLMGEVALCEEDETVIVSMGEIVNGIAGKNNTHTVTIQDDDPCPVQNMQTGNRYPKIQEGETCDYTIDGHTLLVAPGIYHENVHISKSLCLSSEAGSENTLVRAVGGDAMQVVRGNVIILGFTFISENGRPALVLKGGRSILENVILR